jgi:UrcA family protein
MNTHIGRLFRIGPAIAHSATVLTALLALVPGTAKTADLQSDRVLQRLSMKVSLSDLDLTTDRGFQVASERMYQTAQRLCTRVGRIQDIGQHQAFLHCVDRAVASASAELSALAHRSAGPTLASLPESPKQGK